MTYDEMEPVPVIKKIVYGIVNNRGHLLGYSISSNPEWVELEAIERHGKEVWEKLLELGCIIVALDVQVSDTYHNRLAFKEKRNVYSSSTNSR